MSKLIISAAIRGAHTIVSRAKEKHKQAMDKHGATQKVEFPNTGYFLPVIYGMLGYKVEKLEDMSHVFEVCDRLLPPLVKENVHLPYLGPGLDAGMAALFAEECFEAIRYIEDPDFYVLGEDPTDDNLWLGAADDIILRKRGVEFVDGTAPGFAAILGSAPDSETAKNIAEELQKKNLYVFMAGSYDGKSFAEQLVEAGVQVGWGTRLVPFGPDTSAAIFAMGFATRAAMSFGGLEPGDYRKILIYNKDRVFAFAMTLGTVGEEWYANGAGVINWGFPVIADTPIPEVLPTGVCTYEHVVSNISHDQIVTRSTEVRGLKVMVTEVPVPVLYGPAFEGERVRGDEIYMEAGGGRTPCVEISHLKELNEVEDGKVTVEGPDVKDMEAPARVPLGIEVFLAGRKMQDDFLPILERQIHHLVNYAQGMMHIGQRDIAWYRLAKSAVEKGLTLEHIGKILHAKYHEDFGSIVDKVQVQIYTEEDKVKQMIEDSKGIFLKRDERLAGLADEKVDTFYSCTLCQSFAPNHVCVVTPERTGLCGAYNWLDCKASYEINPTGPNQPIEKGEMIDKVYGQWKGVNDFIYKASRGNIDSYDTYGIMRKPMTSCGCFECIAAVLPMCNGLMTVDRDYTAMTPIGMKFSTLAGTVGGGGITPGFVGHSKHFILSKKFESAEGGLKRLVWMPKALKEELKERFNARAEEEGVSDLLDKMADETVGTTEDEVLAHLEKVKHPALELPPLM